MGAVANGTLPVIDNGGMSFYALAFGRNIVVALPTHGSLFPGKEGWPMGSVGIVTRCTPLIKGIVHDCIPFRRIIVTLETYLII
jgi:hypothetical protein